MKIAVLNLARMGDILMSGPLLAELRCSEPEAELHLVVPSRFVAVGRGLDAHHVHGIDVDALALASVQPSSPVELYRRFRAELDGLLTQRFDQVINLGYDNQGALLAHLLGGTVRAGVHLDRHGERRVAGWWSRLASAGHMARGQQPFHLADLQRRFCGLSREDVLPVQFRIPTSARSALQQLETETGLAGHSGPRVVVQVGASHPSKRWSPERFGQTAAKIEAQLGATCVFVGVTGERELVQQALRHAGPGAVDFCGRSDIPTLAALLESSDLVISNDTGTMHLAAAVGTRVLALTFGNALSHETGPYGDGHLVVEPVISCYPCDFHVHCPHFNCHGTLGPDRVAALAVALLSGHDPAKAVDPAEPVRVRRTEFDERGQWRMTDLVPGSISPRDSLRERYRNLLADDPEGPEELGEGSLPGSRTDDPLLRTAIAGHRAARRILQAVDRGETDDLGALAVDIDQARDEILEKHLHRSELHLLLALFRYEVDSDSGEEDLAPLRAAERAFGRLAWRMKRMLSSTAGSLPGTSPPARESRSNGGAEPAGDPAPAPPPNGLARFQRPRMKGDRMTVILFENNYFLQADIANALQRLGHRVIRIEFEDRNDVIENLLLASLEADLLITVNHLGFDEHGELATLLEQIKLPWISWFVDRPGYILLDHPMPRGEMGQIFTWERDSIGELAGYGFERIDYLPLATDETVFAPRGSRSAGLRGPRWVAVTVDGPIADWEERSGVRPDWEPALDDAVQDLLAHRRNSDEALEAAARKHPRIAASWSARDRLNLTSLVAFRATRVDRIRLAKTLSPMGLEIVGDDGWRRHDTGATLRPPVDYGTPLAAYYQDSLQLNSTSFQMPTAVNQRVFDVPAAGGVLLTDEQADLVELFDVNTECFTWSRPGEAAEVARWLLSHSDLARKAAERARARILREHTYTQRVTHILETVRRAHRPAAVARRTA